MKVVNLAANEFKNIPKASIASAFDGIRESKDISLSKLCELCKGSNYQAIYDEVRQLLSKD